MSVLDVKHKNFKKKIDKNIPMLRIKIPEVLQGTKRRSESASSCSVGQETTNAYWKSLKLIEHKTVFEKI